MLCLEFHCMNQPLLQKLHHNIMNIALCSTPHLHKLLIVLCSTPHLHKLHIVLCSTPHLHKLHNVEYCSVSTPHLYKFNVFCTSCITNKYSKAIRFNLITLLSVVVSTGGVSYLSVYFIDNNKLVIICQ